MRIIVTIVGLLLLVLPISALAMPGEGTPSATIEPVVTSNGWETP